MAFVAADWHRASVAPMLDWTDLHCRYFHRLLSRRALLYTEMVTTGALLHGDVDRHLRYNPSEHPLALQLGGSDSSDLARCTRMAEQWGYDEVNLNCGCPSERVQRGAFGACLMAEPALVADCVKAMVDASGLPITVKHRIGIDQQETYGFVRDFVGAVAQAGCNTFIVHARSAWLKGLSPKENREIPPLRYDVVHRLKADFPNLRLVLNGGLSNIGEALEQASQCDGIMVGRSAYHDPWQLQQWDNLFWGDPPNTLTRDHVESEMVNYMSEWAQRDATPWTKIARHMLGLRLGQPGARRWRQIWSNHQLRDLPAVQVAQMARKVLLDAQNTGTA